MVESKDAARPGPSSTAAVQLLGDPGPGELWLDLRYPPVPSSSRVIFESGELLVDLGACKAVWLYFGT